MEMAGEEQLTSQRFDVVIVWSSETAHISAEKVREILADNLQEIDSEATVDVDEMEEPAY